SPVAWSEPAPTITAYNSACCIGDPVAITRGSDGALWFANYSSFLAAKFTIGRITTDGAATVYADPTIGPYGIAPGPDGALWFTNPLQNSIGRTTTAGVLSTFTDPNLFGPQKIVTGPDGNLWFTSYDPNVNDDCMGDHTAIGRITAGGTMTLYPLADYDCP